MVTLSTEDKNFIRKELKPLLTKGDWDKIRRLCGKNSGRFHILCFMAENGIDVFKGLSSIPKEFFLGAEIMQITIPSHIRGIGQHAFLKSTLSGITFEDGVETIGDYAFHGTPISNVVLPDTVETIGAFAFANCRNLSNIFIPDSVTILPRGLFDGCDKVEVYLNSRKQLPKHLQLQIPRGEAAWYKEHAKIKSAGETDGI